MTLTERQKEIIDIVKKYQPITGKEIGERLYLTRSALRTDFSILTGMKILESKPKIGYSYIEKKDSEKVKDIMGPSITVDTNLSVYETILNIFSKDVGTIFITDQGSLVGVVSRKDLLKIAIGKNVNSPEAHNLLGVIAECKGKIGEAQKQYRAALALDSSYEPAACNLERITEMDYSNENIKLG